MCIRASKQRPHFALLSLIALVAAACTPVVAQSSPDATTDRQLIQQLLKRIEELEAAQKETRGKVDDLTTRAPAVSAPIPALEVKQVEMQVEPEASHSLGPLELHGFGDFTYGRSPFEKLPEGGLKGSTNSFSSGDFDLFVNARISDHWSVLGEMLVTSDFSNDYGVEMDRFLLTYKANDYFHIAFGKFNTAIGYYTNGFHRARFFQTATGRPIMFADEDNGGILPVHNIGVTATGKIPSGSLGLNWVAEVANGTSIHSPAIQNFVDENNGKAVNLAIYAKPDWLHGFQTGFSIYRDKLHPDDTLAIQQTILSAHIVYVESKLEWLNEAAMVRHALTGQNQVFNTTTAYTQISRAFGKVRPFVRYEYQNAPHSDPIFGGLGRLNGPSFGVSRRVTNYAVLKLQYGRLGRNQAESNNDFQAQLAFGF